MNKGFIAITLVLMVSGTLLALVGSSSIGTGIFFDMALRKEYRLMNYYNAESCIDQAILRLAQDYFYLVDNPVSVPHFNCSILEIFPEGELRHIRTRGDLQKAYVYRIATVRLNIHDLDVVKIE